MIRLSDLSVMAIPISSVVLSQAVNERIASSKAVRYFIFIILVGLYTYL